MRKLLYAVPLAAATALAVIPAQAAPEGYYANPRVVAPAAGVVAGTVAGVGITEGWWGSSVVGTALPASAAGAAVAGGVVGVGALALVDAATEPCRGFAALFDLSSGECVNGEYVGYPQPPQMHPRYRHYR